MRVEALPAVEVPAAAVELAITNYVSNAIKYHDPAATPHAWAAVRGRLTEATDTSDDDSEDGRRGPEVVVEVWDNGRGVPASHRAGLFAQGFRAHLESVTGVEGTGVGLSLVKDAIESLGGRVWATFPPDGGACFAFALPARRAEERAGAGTDAARDPGA